MTVSPSHARFYEIETQFYMLRPPSNPDNLQNSCCKRLNKSRCITKREFLSVIYINRPEVSSTKTNLRAPPEQILFSFFKSYFEVKFVIMYCSVIYW